MSENYVEVALCFSDNLLEGFLCDNKSFVYREKSHFCNR